ncbi:hypothetical protein [Micromonospora sp. KC721]|uniref:hypothetical protein n=1 Tax=Micromonospora sp. KC721 TaxID=2530380 RepID=UPI001048DEE9|nr:hypothetical protein [Micromonospora sp. KC721]TDB81496.1 hypothetical protein E1182_05175 [Micromonospora sp. KC721]
MDDNWLGQGRRKRHGLMPNPEISGWVDLRPLRIGLLFKPTLAAFATAVKHATASWGGIYFPFIDPTDETTALRASAVLDVDVLHAVDDSSESQQLSRQDGYRWRTGGEWGPFGVGGNVFPSHVQGVDWIYDEDPEFTRYSYPKWRPDHPLANIFTALYGAFGDDDFSRTTASAFERRSHSSDAGEAIEEFGRWPDDPGYLTPILLTGKEIRYSGDWEGVAVVVTDPDDAARLCLLWNLRASGAQVFPWVNGHEEASNASLDLWLDRRLDEKLIPNHTRGDGVSLGPHLAIHVPPHTQIPEKLASLLAGKGVTCWRTEGGATPARGWIGHHPFHTEFSQVFRVESSRRRIFDIPLPAMGNARWKRKHQPGFLAADIIITSVRDLGPDLTLVMPAMRELSALIHDRGVTDERAHRVTVDGRSVAVRSDAGAVEISPVRSIDVIERVASGTGWAYRQTDNGRFSGRLIERLGGRSSYVANQPAVRTVMTKAANSHTGRPITALISHAKREQGAWPSFLMRQPAATYPTDVVHYLLTRKTLQAVLPVRCPRCSAEVPVRPEDLRSDHNCELCGEQTPLALALGKRTRNDWLYRLAPEIAPERLSETLPVMAVLSALGSHSTLDAYPFALGLEVTSPTSKFELDVTMILDGSPRPLVVVGEVKSYRDPITAEDVANLRIMQSFLRGKQIDCYILAATLQEKLPDETVAALRSACEEAPPSIGHVVLPVFPIVLTGQNLSVPYMHEDHPTKWNEVGTGLSTLAVESCKRNLGLVDARFEGRKGGSDFVPIWQTPA